MDQNLVTRRFIELARKLRDDARKARETLHSDLSRLADRLKDLKDAVPKPRHTDAESVDHPHVTIAELRTSAPSRVQTEKNRGKVETWWRRTKSGLEALGIVAVILYTIFAYRQWQAMTWANQISMSNFTRARIDANGQLKQAMAQTEEATRNFRADQRAWIGVVIAKTDTRGLPFPITLVYHFKNHGKSPATDVVTTDNAHVYGEQFPSTPFYEKTMPSPEVNSKATVFPGQENELFGTANICQKDIDDINAGTKWCYTYGIITYKDEFGTKHTTHFCYRHGKPEINVVCDTYTDAD